jgi:5-methylcytosine-specific restriction protein A
LGSAPVGLPVTSWRTDKRTTAERGYGARWQREAKAFLREPENVLCRMCSEEGFVVVARVVDHRIPHRGDQALFWDRLNWQPLCKSHHSGAKQAEEKSGRTIRKGVDRNGWPTDPSHPWSREAAPRS